MQFKSFSLKLLTGDQLPQRLHRVSNQTDLSDQ